MPRRWRRSSCAGSRSRAIRSTRAATPSSPSVYAPPLATGENLYSTQDVENLVRFGGWRADRDIIQVDPPQAYGIGQYAKHARHAGEARLAAHVVASARRQSDVARLWPPASAWAAPSPIPACSAISAALPTTRTIENGAISLSDRPGIGFEGQAALYKIMRELAGI